MLQLTPEQTARRIPAGTILLTRNPASRLTRGITFGQSLESGQVATWGHAMRMSGQGMVTSQETRRKLLPLPNWQGCHLRAWMNPAYTERDYSRLDNEACLRLGTRYDPLGCVLGQMLRAVPLVGDWLASRLDVPWTNFCSEGECEIERKLTPGFGGRGTCQISPQDIDDWCGSAGWQSLTFRLL